MGEAEYLRKPYGRTVVPEPDGTFRAEIMEFPGCIATGDTASEALANLEEVAASWLEATIAKGQRVPDPIENMPFSGKLVVRMPKSLHRKAAHLAAREGVSLNQYIVASVAEQVGGATGRASTVSGWSAVQQIAHFYFQVGLTPAPDRYTMAFPDSGIASQLGAPYAVNKVTGLPVTLTRRA
jgi:predicted RNase H-like HicB family nuclease